MAKMTQGTVLVEVTAAELEMLRTGLRAAYDYAVWDSDEELETLNSLRRDLGERAHG